MNDSHDIDMPYHPGCKHRYMEHLDHSALLKRLNEIADEIYRLTQLCSDMETRLSDHNSSTDAHRYLRDLVNSTTSRISIIKESIDAEIAALGNRVDSADSTLAAADAQLGNRIDNLATEIDGIRGIIDSTGVAFEASINSDVAGDTPIIQSTADTNSVTLSELPSEHGNFKFSTEVTKNIITYTNDNNTSGAPNHTAVLLDESGNSNFPGTVTAETFNGKATEAVISDTTKKLETAINITVKDAGGENSGVTATTDMSGDITLKLPSTLKDTNITGVANKAISDGAGATITDTYMHKTNVNEEIHGNKTFNDVIKSDTLVPKAHTGSTLGNSTIPYEYVYGTNINGVTATIPNITGSLTGNATTATKLATARAINGTNFDGSTAITTNSWGTARNISIADASATNTGTATSVNGSGNVTLKLPATIKAALTGNASTATKLNTAKKINNTAFDGSADITTALWGTARNISIADASATNTGTATSVNGSGNVTLKLPATISANAFNGPASSAKKLNTAIRINGTPFDGSTDITTAVWGYARNFSITSSDGTGASGAVSINGSSDIALKLPATIKANIAGNIDTATKLKTARTINSTSFDGSANITTALWGTARNISIADASATNTGTATSVNGSGNVTLKLPATISANAFNGPASSAKKLNTAIRINGTPFDGSTDITTAVWGYARNFSITSSDGTGASGAVSINGSSDIALKLPATIKAALTGNASTATKLNTAKKINNTAFDGSADITTALWGTARNISIADASATNTGTATSVNGSGNVTLKLPATIKANIAGNIDTATKLATARTINGTNFDGSAAITTAQWGTARNISIADNSGTNTGTAVSVNGAANATLKLPATIEASLTGNASTATKFAAKQAITLTGDVTGTISSQAGWSIATTLANSGVTAGSYGNSTNQTPTYSGTFKVPYITVDAKGRVTSIANRTVTLPVKPENTGVNISLGEEETLWYRLCATQRGYYCDRGYTDGEIVPGASLFFDGSHVTSTLSGSYLAIGSATHKRTEDGARLENLDGDDSVTWHYFKQKFRKIIWNL